MSTGRFSSAEPPYSWRFDKDRFRPSERRVGVVNAPVGVDDWVIGVLFVDDVSGVFRASLDSPSRRQQIEIKGKGYRALLQQAQHIAGLHVGLIYSDEWWS